MRICKKYNFHGVTGFELGRSYFLPPLMTTYCYTLGDIMIDTGQFHMQKEVLNIARDHRIKRVLLTHHHEDHSGNAAIIKQNLNARVFGHPLTKIKMQATSKILPYQKYMWGKATRLTIEILPEKIKTDLGDIIPIHTPGHAKDHTSFFIRDKGILFSGDLFLADKIKFFRSDEVVRTQILSLKKILTLDFDMLLCGHHPKPAKGKIHIKNKLDFLEKFEGNVIKFHQKGYSVKQIFNALKLKENYFIKYFCFGNVSMINGVRSVVRYCKESQNYTEKT